MAKRKLTKRADGRYQSQIYLGTDENGKRIIKTLYGANDFPWSFLKGARSVYG